MPILNPRSLRPACLALSALLILPCGLSAAEGDAAVQTSQAELDAKIARLIEQLGAEQFATREKAQAELERLGLVAFDALHEAQHHDDLEVAMRARYLVHSMRVHWALEEDPVAVKKILRGYGSQNEAERKNRMDRLAMLEHSDGVAALCRLVRFESSRRLSKRAALLVMNHRAPQEEAERAKLAETIRATMGLSKRPGAQWLRAYALTLVQPDAALDQWEAMTEAEHETLTQFPERSNREIVRDLFRWQAELLLRLGRRQRAAAAMKRSIDLLDGSPEQILDMVDWLMVRKAWQVVQEVADRYSTRFQEDALLAYLLAESQLQLGHPAQAQQLADRATGLLPDDAKAHVEAAVDLQERGLLEWAEREYRRAIQLGPAGALHPLRSSLLLAEMLHDVGKELPAAKVLQDAVDAVQKDPTALEVLRTGLGRELGSIKSRMYYFYARHRRSLNDRQKEIEFLEKAVQSDPTDADVLIAMYRVADADPAWREKTLKYIDKATAHFRDQIAQFQRQVAQAPNEPFRELANRMLASANNQLAWLVSNTVGDYDEAIRCSRRSLELRPNTGGYLDTLGRCYYAKGDLANAVKYQARAAQLEPYSQQIQRQLAFFRKALADSKKEGGRTESPSQKAPEHPTKHNG